MGCQHAVARQIQDQGGHYVLALKGNQSTLHEDVFSFFEQQRLEQFRFTEGRWTVETTLEKGHGRIREGYGAENLHMVRQVAMSCIRGYVRGLSQRVSLRRVVKLAGWDDSVMGAILCAK